MQQDVAAAILMSLQLIITHKRKQINQKPLHGDGWVERREAAGSGIVAWKEKKKKKQLVSPRVLFTTTRRCQGFSWGTLVLIKTGPHIKFGTISKAGELYWRFIKALEQMNVPSLSRLDRFNKRGPGLYHARITPEFNAHLFLWMMFATKAFANWLIKTVILT